MDKCLVTKLDAVINDPKFPYLDKIRISFNKQSGDVTDYRKRGLSYSAPTPIKFEVEGDVNANLCSSNGNIIGKSYTGNGNGNVLCTTNYDCAMLLSLNITKIEDLGGNGISGVSKDIKFHLSEINRLCDLTFLQCRNSVVEDSIELLTKTTNLIYLNIIGTNAYGNMNKMVESWIAKGRSYTDYPNCSIFGNGIITITKTDGSTIIAGASEYKVIFSSGGHYKITDANGNTLCEK